MTNLILYPIYAALSSCYFWMPVFFLYFSERVSLSDVLWLEAVYYVSVVGFEVPSGYFSDRFGRRITLLISSFAFLGSYVLFFFSESLPSLVLAQALLGVGFAFNSGTDTSLHYDSLLDVGRENEYGHREATIRSRAYICEALAILIGGASAWYGTRYAYGLNAFTAIGSVAVTWAFKEPGSRTQANALDSANTFGTQIKASLRYLHVRPLAWLFAFAVLMTIVNHLPYEFYQPYLETLAEKNSWPQSSVPVLSAVVMAAGLFVASFVSRFSITVAERMGVGASLLTTLVLQTTVIVVMSIFVHPLVLVLIAFRKSPDALAGPVLLAQAAPHISSAHRATYLSLQSLCGRLCYAAVLASFSLVTSVFQPSNAVALLLMLGAGVSVAGGLVLWIWSAKQGVFASAADVQR